MKYAHFIRQAHRWLSIIFTGVIIAIFAILGLGHEPAEWFYYTPLPPLLLMLLSGLYLFFLPYVARRRRGGSGS